MPTMHVCAHSSSVGSNSSQVRYSGLTRSRAGLSSTFAGIKVTLIGRGGSTPGGIDGLANRAAQPS
jgi:hypothetical protein